MNISIDHSCSSSATSATGVGMATNKKDEDGTCYNENYLDDETQQHRTQTDDCHDATYQINSDESRNQDTFTFAYHLAIFPERQEETDNQREQHSYYPKYGKHLFRQFSSLAQDKNQDRYRQDAQHAIERRFDREARQPFLSENHILVELDATNLRHDNQYARYHTEERTEETIIILVAPPENIHSHEIESQEFQERDGKNHSQCHIQQAFAF